jgi:hypothetical protein
MPFSPGLSFLLTRVSRGNLESQASCDSDQSVVGGVGGLFGLGVRQYCNEWLVSGLCSNSEFGILRYSC